jgi:hypothetical protein
MKLSITITFVHLIALTAFSQDASHPDETLQIKPTADFEITGEGNAAAWENTEWISLTKRQGEKPYTTRAKLLYSEQGIYVLFHCDDKKISATKTEDFTDLWKEDVVEIFFWTDESTPLYFEYELSPLNYELAILVPNFNGDFLGWKPWGYEGDRKTKHKVTLSKDEAQNITAWTAEIFIPYKLLKPLQNVPAKKGTQWRMNMYRIDHDDGRSSWSWKKVKTNFHDYKNFGIMLFN